MLLYLLLSLLLSLLLLLLLLIMVLEPREGFLSPAPTLLQGLLLAPGGLGPGSQKFSVWRLRFVRIWSASVQGCVPPQGKRGSVDLWYRLCGACMP